MTAPIEDVSSLPGKKVADQADNPIGKVKEIYATDDGFPMWVAVEVSTGIAGRRTVFVPLARLKEEDGELRVPYSKRRIGEAPEVADSEGISAERDRELRDYYGIDTGDQEMRDDNNSYATLVSEEAGSAELVEDPDRGSRRPMPTRGARRAMERLNDPGSSETRKVTAADVSHDDQDTGGQDAGDKDGDDDAEAGDEDGDDDAEGGD